MSALCIATLSLVFLERVKLIMLATKDVDYYLIVLHDGSAKRHTLAFPMLLLMAHLSLVLPVYKLNTHFVRTTMWRLPLCQFCMHLRQLYSIFLKRLFHVCNAAAKKKRHNFIIYFLPIAVVQMLSDRLFCFSATTYIPPAHAIHSFAQIATAMQPHCLYCVAHFSREYFFECSQKHQQ